MEAVATQFSSAVARSLDGVAIAPSGTVAVPSWLFAAEACETCEMPPLRWQIAVARKPLSSERASVGDVRKNRPINFIRGGWQSRFKMDIEKPEYTRRLGLLPYLLSPLQRQGTTTCDPETQLSRLHPGRTAT
ncbi:hypothetical protein HJFPF1_01205 [Paramyrothecium foliicola]|nr:hypothetical protein HJFPF1_01205 [Paramyrothecium foliicola]